MKEQFVTYEIALAIKELGFDEISRFGTETSLYDNKGLHIFYSNYGMYYSGLDKGYIYAPLWQQVIDWFYVKHKFIIYYGTDDWSLVTPKESFLYNELINTSVYEKWEQAILKCIELCKK